MTDDGLDERKIVMNGPVMLPWAEREKKGALRASLRTVLRGLLFPSRTFQITEATPSGRAFFFYAFGIGCCIPMTLLSLMFIHAEYINPDLFHFQDVNPLTTLVAIPLQMVVGPLVIWLWGWCLFAAAKVVSVATLPGRDTVRNLGWYLGTVMLFVVYTWLGIMVPLYSIRAWSRHVDPGEILISITLFAGLAILLRTSLCAIKATLKTTWLKAALGLAVALILLSLTGLPVAILVNVILVVAMG